MNLRALPLFLSGLTLAAQWTHQPTPGIPRRLDGKPDLNAPAPSLAEGKADMSGIWVRVPPPGNPGGPNFGNTVTWYMSAGAEVPLQPWAAELLRRRRYEDLGGGRPSERCLPHGVIGAMLPNTPFKIAHTPGVTFLLYEQLNQYRQIFTDGRQHPVDPNPAWWGYSIGHWKARRSSSKRADSTTRLGSTIAVIPTPRPCGQSKHFAVRALATWIWK